MNRLRQILTVFLVGLTFFVMQAFGYGNALIAQAEETVESPVGIYYKGTPSDTGSNTSSNKSSDTSKIQNDNKLVEKARKNLKETADNVREKANNFGESVSGSSDGNVKSPVGIYYKGTPSDTSSDTSNIQDDNNLIEKATKKVKETADNLRASVDLDENVTTPEANYYKAQPQTTTTSKGNNPIKQATESLKETADNVREKLNLDEELPRSTKEFLNSTEKRVEKTVAPVTGTKEGYYQEPPQVR
ncbi:hypothetical protein SAMD00079811_50650 [Scytonema sp. HK-05]|uniref:hypothetical protein n=1 Tax=Scytonema sp. HK-05 TaxID=1137095 RepID=UPI000936B9A8|nr:hypothetical protein [Scytonema sp. HK-05]OKH57998.1 hypothetical protein NIES2130_16770 [Scytonema sp. HK-05]BAY47447.1 hypothetical protein SAMD00079811_50650 [Scytonema sp. HK-05]